MKYTDIHRFNTEYLGQEKPKVFYNPDNTVAIFEESDAAVWEYVFENGAKLKENNFAMNHESYDKITEYLQANPKESEKKEKATEKNSAPALPTLSKKQKEKILDQLDDKPTVAKLTAIVRELVQHLG